MKPIIFLRVYNLLPARHLERGGNDTEILKLREQLRRELQNETLQLYAIHATPCSEQEPIHVHATICCQERDYKPLLTSIRNIMLAWRKAGLKGTSTLRETRPDPIIQIIGWRGEGQYATYADIGASSQQVERAHIPPETAKHTLHLADFKSPRDSTPPKKGRAQVAR